MATGEHIKLLINAHYESEDRFRTRVLQIVAYEKDKGHIALARELKGIIDSQKKFFKKNILNENNLSDLLKCSLSDTKLNEMVLNDKVVTKIQRLIKEYNSKEKLKKYGLKNRRKILLCGPPGTGKTMTAAVLANKLNLPLCVVMMEKMLTKYMGESGVKLRQIFDTIEEYQGVYLFDEFDAIGSDRNLDNDIGEIRRILNLFLQFIENDKSESIIIAATNNPKILDQALFRRFDDIIYYLKPEKLEVIKLIKNKIVEFKDKNINFDLVGEKAEGLSFADITKICNDSIKEMILDNKEYITEELLLKHIKEKKMEYLKGEGVDES